MFEYEASVDPVEQSKKVGKAFAQAHHEVARRGIKSFLFQASSVEEFDQRMVMTDGAITEIADQHLGEVSDGKAKIARSIRQEFEQREAASGPGVTQPGVGGRNMTMDLGNPPGGRCSGNTGPQYGYQGCGATANITIDGKQYCDDHARKIKQAQGNVNEQAENDALAEEEGVRQADAAYQRGASVITADKVPNTPTTDDIVNQNSQNAKGFTEQSSSRPCPKCGSHMEDQGGTNVCPQCGYSEPIYHDAQPFGAPPT